MRYLLVAVMALTTACSPMVYTHGIPNLAQVDPGVWRTGQITTVEGWHWLRQITGAKRLHVIKLNYANEGSDDLAERMGIDVHYLPVQPQGDQDIWDDLMAAFKGPDPTRVAEAIKLLKTASVDDVWVVHCTHGQDRTGFVIGTYRVLVDGWTKDRAYGEMLAHHFHSDLLGIQEAWEHWKP